MYAPSRPSRSNVGCVRGAAFDSEYNSFAVNDKIRPFVGMGIGMSPLLPAPLMHLLINIPAPKITIDPMMPPIMAPIELLESAAAASASYKYIVVVVVVVLVSIVVLVVAVLTDVVVVVSDVVIVVVEIVVMLEVVVVNDVVVVVIVVVIVAVVVVEEAVVEVVVVNVDVVVWLVVVLVSVVIVVEDFVDVFDVVVPVVEVKVVTVELVVSWNLGIARLTELPPPIPPTTISIFSPSIKVPKLLLVSGKSLRALHVFVGISYNLALFR